MILRIIILACAILSPSLGKLDMRKFTLHFEDKCFQNEQEDPFRINGQDTPLSNTLENFIALAEKFEAANPSFDLKDELSYFISEYVFENIEFVNGRAGVWQIGRANFKLVDAMWDPDTVGYKPTAVDPFTDAEQCSLFHMISHSLIDMDKQLLSKSYSPVNSNYSYDLNRATKLAMDPSNYYPQEMGVVAIRGTELAVSLSKVLIGLYVGLTPNRRKDLTGYEDIQNLEIPAELLPTDKTVDSLYTVTMADILVRSMWIGSARPKLARNGIWLSTPFGNDKSISGFCPMVYKHPSPDAYLPAYSYSSVRGAADGLLLGLAALPVYQKKSSSKLSQLLRMYYSPEGITLEDFLEGTTSKRVSFCDRGNLISSLENRLHDQMLSYGYLIADSAKDVKSVVESAENLYNKEKAIIYENSNADIRDYCTKSASLERPEELPRETFLDIIVVMDSGSSGNSESLEHFQEQQLIVGYLAKMLDLRYTGSRMTILIDQKITPEEMQQTSKSSSSSRIMLKPVVYDTHSCSCAACHVGQIEHEPSTIERDQVIAAISQLLTERKEKESKYSGVNGKVVIYFNYDGNDQRNGNNKVQGSLERALRDLHLNHQDVLFYGVGLDSELLKKYVKKDPSLVFLGTDGTPDVVAKKIFERITLSPALFQYADCKEARSENSATYENFISPRKVQHYEMPAEYFLKSRDIKFHFDSHNGYVRVCFNRVTMKPENEFRNCKNTSSSGIEFQISNPCKGLTETNCSPFYFSIIGMDTNSELRPDNRQRSFCDDIQEHWCSNLHQVKYKVSHSGIRCSGCLGIGATPAVIFFTLLLTYFIHKRF